MKIHLEEKEEFKIAGLKLDGKFQSNFTKLWEELFEKVSIETAKSFGEGICYGACYDFTQDSYSYMAGYEVEDIAAATDLGLEILEIPTAKYAVFEIQGAIPGSIHSAWEYIMGEYLPNNDYIHGPSPDFELYFDGDTSSEEYKMQLWIPVAKRV